MSQINHSKRSVEYIIQHCKDMGSFYASLNDDKADAYFSILNLAQSFHHQDLVMEARTRGLEYAA